MTEHKFKVGDMVVTKPMKVVELLNIGRNTAIELQTPDDGVKLIVRDSWLTPIHPSSDVVETIAKRLFWIGHNIMHDHEAEWRAYGNKPLFYESAQAAITALESQGYSRQPSVKGLVEALKNLTAFYAWYVLNHEGYRKEAEGLHKLTVFEAARAALDATGGR